MIPCFVAGKVRNLSGRLDLSDLSVEYLASTLAKLNRFIGHTPYPYSVAQHAVLVSALASPEWAYEALHHDDTEALVGDLASPIKKGCPGFRRLEARVRGPLARRFGLARKEPKQVKQWDLEARKLEQWVIQGRRDMPKPALADDEDVHVLLAETPWRVARDLFIWRHERLWYADSY